MTRLVSDSCSRQVISERFPSTASRIITDHNVLNIQTVASSIDYLGCVYRPSCHERERVPKWINPNPKQIILVTKETNLVSVEICWRCQTAEACGQCIHWNRTVSDSDWTCTKRPLHITPHTPLQITPLTSAAQQRVSDINVDVLSSFTRQE